MSYKKFRLDINGLRAVAVLSVVLFHFGVPYVSGGFTGVDVFFVISGFLMTGIVLEKVDHKSIFDFYVARFLRIVPALVAIILALLIFGYFSLSTSEFELLARNATASLLFYSNNYYAAHSSYFDPSSDLNFLLHTWSLSVEWQFYLIYPLIVLAIKKCRLPVSLSILALFCLSLVYVALGLSGTKEDLFYLLPTRAWEMLTGALVYIISTRGVLTNFRHLSKLNIPGLLLILFSLFTVEGSQAWPGLATLIPVAGAALVILANNQNAYLIKNKTAQFIGTISYSWYLWHWPVVVLMRYYRVEMNAINIGAGIAVSFILAVISYYLIEMPFRKRNWLRTDFISAIVITSCAFMVVQTHGATFRFKGDMNDVITYRFNNKEWRPDTCFLNPRQDYSVFSKCQDKMTSESIVIWGDSHAAQLMPGIRSVLKNDNFTQRTSSLCGPLYSAENSQRPFCKDINKNIIAELLRVKPKLVVLAAFWSQYPFKDYLADTLKMLSSAGIRTVVIGPFPFWHDHLPKIIETNGLNPQGTMPVTLFDSSRNVLGDDKSIEKIVSASANSTYISAIDIMCSKATCKATVGKNPTIPMQWDNAHLTYPGSIWFVSHIINMLH
ncbi:acyltransferase family protein [Enterobacter sp. CP102]|uniref:acyltransferase family protein n=1 Tax=Enterobacter sp. CP102 TaxID=2976431 RepID=UPI00220E6982|nr:acyltransferase family protein [Enterobacter sp. CP102]UWM62654.1 acyltransferase [Enterobacter sp. CP102]